MEELFLVFVRVVSDNRHWCLPLVLCVTVVMSGLEFWSFAKEVFEDFRC